MNTLDNLTERRQIMNMAKPGTVSRSKDFKNLTQYPVNTRKDAITRYTLCEV